MDNIKKNITGEKLTIVLICTLLTLMVVINPYDKTTLSRFLSILIMSLSLIPYLVWRKDRHREKIIPGVIWYGLFYFICFGFTGLIGHQVAQGFLDQSYSQESENIAKLLVATHLFIVFSVLYCLELLFKRKPIAENTSSKDGSKLFYFIIFLCLILAISRYFVGEPYGGLIVTMVSYLSFSYLFYFLFLKDKGNLPLKILACVGWVIASGGYERSCSCIVLMMPFIHLVLLLLLLTLQKKGKIPIIPALIMFFAVIIYQPLKAPIRNLMTETNASAADSIAIGLDQVMGQDLLGIIDLTSLRFDHNGTFSSVVEHVSPNEYYKWEAYKTLPYVAIPRFLWPEKPTEFFGNVWGVQEGFLQPTDYLTSFNIPWLIQMYLSYGPTGTIIGSFVVAAILFLISRLYWFAPRRDWDYAMGITILICIFNIDSDFTNTFGLAIKFMIIDFFIRFFRNAINLEKKRIQ